MITRKVYHVEYEVRREVGSAFRSTIVVLARDAADAIGICDRLVREDDDACAEDREAEGEPTAAITAVVPLAVTPITGDDRKPLAVTIKAGWQDA